MGEKTNHSNRHRNYACVFYPDAVSLEDARLYFISRHIQAFISPLHEPDPVVDMTDSGELVEHVLKPHYHVLMCWDGSIAETSVKNLLSGLNTTRIFPVTSKKSYARYLCHIDDPDKQQFTRPYDVKSTLGGDYSLLVADDVENDRVVMEILEYVKLRRLIYFDQLINHCMESELTWFKALNKSKNVSLITSYMRSLEYRMRNATGADDIPLGW